MKIQVASTKHGTHQIYFDKSCRDAVLSYNWSLVKKNNILYAVTCLWPSNKMLYMHSLIMKYKKGDGHIDHKDGNGLNNRKRNLRLATASQNIANSGLRKNNTSGYKGVSILKGKYYMAFIKVKRKRIYGGLFDSKEKAARKYNELAVKYFGEFANLNIIS